MSFWKNVGKVATSVGKVATNVAMHLLEEAQKKEERINKIQSRVSEKSDEEVVRKHKNATFSEEKQAYVRELEERGYLSRDSEGKYQRTNKTL
ncbi:hypothetical protein SIL77_00140 [Exiguobacterium profundum]|uniref:hypothetical protein n=1 Tax=Exiguobacterium profundum TaxID=307643 RepID=UPI0029C14561|nr:hypothetical protein [Exiguobacterium profundum]MDX5979681.1 hypothetical protein [Exiguobacterium profundum]